MVAYTRLQYRRKEESRYLRSVALILRSAFHEGSLAVVKL